MVFLIFLFCNGSGGEHFLAHVLGQSFCDLLLNHRFANNGFPFGFCETLTEAFDSTRRVD